MTKSINTPAIYQFENHEIRTQIIDDEPWFCLKDVCGILGIVQAGSLKRRLNPNGVRKTHTLTAGGRQQLIYINESNLYKTIFQSEKPEALQFEDYVTGEILPTIRKTGSYTVSGQSGSNTNQLDAPLTKDQRKRVSGLVSIFSQHSHYSRMECWQLVHAKFEVATVEDLKASQYQALVDWLEAQSRLNMPEVDFITRQALAGVKAFTARLTVEEAISKTAKAVHREFKVNIYITEEKPKHEIAACIDAMTDAHQKRLDRAGIR